MIQVKIALRRRLLMVAMSGAVFAPAGCGSPTPISAPLEHDPIRIDLTLDSSSSLPRCSGVSAGTVAYVASPPSLSACAGNAWIPLPCNNGHAGEVGYATATKTLVACDGRSWLPIAIPAGPEGLPGVQGPPGPAGQSALIVVSNEGPGYCPSGGARIDAGIDLNGDGILEPNEVQSTSHVCNGTSASICGDGKVDPATEQCDDGADTVTCNADCTIARCGDRHTNAAAGEQCDDGNVAAGDGCSPTCQFETVPAAARLVVSEVNPGIANGNDLLELRAVTGGSVENISIKQDLLAGEVLSTLPKIFVAPGDLIVVHFGVASVASELSSKSDCLAPGCYPGAWDVDASGNNLHGRSSVLAILGPDGAFQDAVPFAQMNSAPPEFPADLGFLQSLGRWSPADCGGSSCTYTSMPSALDVSVDWSACGTSAAGLSVQRVMGGDGLRAAEWTIGPPSWGLP